MHYVSTNWCDFQKFENIKFFIHPHSFQSISFHHVIVKTFCVDFLLYSSSTPQFNSPNSIICHGLKVIAVWKFVIPKICFLTCLYCETYQSNDILSLRKIIAHRQHNLTKLSEIRKFFIQLHNPTTPFKSIIFQLI